MRHATRLAAIRSGPVAGALLPCVAALIATLWLGQSGHYVSGLAALSIGATVSVVLLTRQVMRLHDLSREREAQLIAALRADGFRDAATGLGTTQLLRVDWGRQLARLQRRGERLSLARIEVNEPPRTTPVAHHEIIQAVASALHELVRADDAVYRLGPTRFGVLLAGSDYDGGLRFVERAAASLAVVDLASGERVALHVAVDIFDWTDGIEDLTLGTERLEDPVEFANPDLLLSRWAGQRGRFHHAA